MHSVQAASASARPVEPFVYQDRLGRNWVGIVQFSLDKVAYVIIDSIFLCGIFSHVNIFVGFFPTFYEM